MGGAQQEMGANAAVIQPYGPYRQRRRVPIMVPRFPPAAERASDNTLLRWHREQISRWVESFNEKKNVVLMVHQALLQIVIF